MTVIVPLGPAGFGTGSTWNVGSSPQSLIWSLVHCTLFISYSIQGPSLHPTHVPLRPSSGVGPCSPSERRLHFSPVPVKSSPLPLPFQDRRPSSSPTDCFSSSSLPVPVSLVFPVSILDYNRPSVPVQRVLLTRRFRPHSVPLLD